MPIGTGAINERNLPSSAYEVNPPLFNQLTSKQVFNPANFPLAGPANYVTKTLRQVGIISRLRFIIKGSLVVTGMGAGSTLIPTFKWPYGIVRVALTGNQQNNFINVNGTDLHYRALSAYRAYVDSYSVAGIGPAGVSTATGNATYPFQIALEVPIAMDQTTLVGALYAQSEATNLTITLTTEAIANLFTFVSTGAIVLADYSGNIANTPVCNVEETIYSIPYSPGKSGVLVIPDLTVLHGLISNDNPVASQTDVTTELYRSNANLERFFFYTDDTNRLVTTAQYNYAEFIYGAKEVPYTWNPMDFKRFATQIDNRLALPDGVFDLDFVAENAARDQVILEGVTNLRMHTNYIAGQPATAGAKVHFVQETLFA